MILDWFLHFRSSESSSNQHDPRNTSPEESSQSGATASGPQFKNQSNGFFANATGFTIGEAQMLDHPQFNYQTINNTIVTGTAALERLLPHTCPGAAVDSSARHPAPQCHPGTRRRILTTLGGWIENPKRLWKMIWLNGPAGTGKSAVAQTFAETCAERSRLGAAYFFSRPHKRSDPGTIIPTLAYQLAVNLPDYGSLLANIIARDLTIFEKTLRVQFRRLIVEPFSLLQAQGHWIIQEPLLIILDGLDECKGIDAQCEVVEVIGEVIRLKGNLPLLWLVSSRPEPHLKYIFSRADFSIDCGKERLLIDLETRDDVERYLRDSFNDIRARFPYVTDASWPSEAQSRRVGDIASGLFALASTITRYIGDLTYEDPVGRLADFLTFVENTDRAFPTNPLETLDLLYFQILANVPEDVVPLTRRILSLYALYDTVYMDIPVQVMCNFLGIDKRGFYNAFSKLHSVFDVPSPETAAEVPLRMYHTSFSDYLLSSTRSGRFSINKQEAMFDFAKMCLFWYKISLEDPHHISDDSFRAAKEAAQDTILPGLTWSSPDTDLDVSLMLKRISRNVSWSAFGLLSHEDTRDLLSQLEDFDFRYMKVDFYDGNFARFANWLFKWGPLNTLVHSEPGNELEKTLLNKAASESDRPMEPIAFPIDVEKDGSKCVYRYLFIGRGLQTCLFWFDEDYDLNGRCRLSYKAPPGEIYTVSDCVVHGIE